MLQYFVKEHQWSCLWSIFCQTYRHHKFFSILCLTCFREVYPWPVKSSGVSQSKIRCQMAIVPNKLLNSFIPPTNLPVPLRFVKAMFFLLYMFPLGKQPITPDDTKQSIKTQHLEMNQSDAPTAYDRRDSWVGKAKHIVQWWRLEEPSRKLNEN